MEKSRLCDGYVAKYWKMARRPHTDAIPLSSTAHETSIVHLGSYAFSLHFKARLSAEKSVFIHTEISTNYHNKNFALRHTLKESRRGTRERPIGERGYIPRASMPYSRPYINTYEHLFVKSLLVINCDRLSLSLINYTYHRSTIPITDQQSLTKITCPDHWSTVPSTYQQSLWMISSPYRRLLVPRSP